MTFFFIFKDEIFIAKTNYIDSYSISNNISKMQASSSSTRQNWILYVLKYSRIKIFSGAHVTI